MAKDKTKKRLRKALRKMEKRRRQEAQRHPLDMGRGQGFPDLPPPWDGLFDDEDRGDDFDGGAGVREPRHPFPTMPAAALELDEPRPLYLDLTR